MPKFSPASLKRLEEVHPDLKRVFEVVIKERDCQVTCGWRSKADQDKAIADKASKLAWPKSKHNCYPSYAIDVIPLHATAPHVRWNDLEAFINFGNYVQGVAAGMGIAIEWGGDWKTFKDYPHFEIPSRPLNPVFDKPKAPKA